MTHNIRRNLRGKAVRLLGWTALAAFSTGAIAQTVADQQVPDTNLNIPANLQIFGKLDPNVRKPTAIVNDTVITGTDVDQRLALTVFNNGGRTPPPDQIDEFKLQILRQLIDETLEIQEAKSAEITVTQAELDQSEAGLAKRFNMTVPQLRVALRKAGSSERSLRRAIEGELAWSRYLRRKIEPFVNVGDEEVSAIQKRIEASRGTEEYNLKEIYLSANDANRAQVFAKAKQIIGEIQKAQQPFELFARNYSEASTRGVGGDLGWIRLVTLPQPLAEATQQMQVGQIAGPIETPGGFSILYLTDKRTIGAADPRDAKLSLKQLTVAFPAGTTQAQASARAATFAKTVQSIQGCGTVEKIAAGIGAEVVDNDSIRIRDLPAPLQEILLKMQVGQATPPFGSPTEGVRALVLCGRDDPQASVVPGAAQIQGQLEQQRVNLRAQSKLRDLRRDAVIEYR
ncbi:peptidylprolyl isomerase [Arthrobacter sp. TPD3018]|uniref:Parvulin-like PPIase n=1 Tax=Sphingomonas melonis TY TaxID=621456 RepID=A0A154NBE8_9SPHN|nr:MULTISPECIES: peptidylprolyl isomerase [Bacteria]AOW23611.1 peptidylprolyl isomerase [Sphingomonas melonis TY]ATI54609.1 peptidylprolyl isomerase [Sphingomonas melonis]KZB97006.1 peptidylprolyl isomerase [Sphingomonas melonis TY]MBX8844670.1 peptidylprolyl isomerase [Sphingomonas melonis]MBX8853726.1 peptidylprolyl isomerase [Sphingomonas melonis]